jgi:dolichyl-phosphate-mannose--protein O-mannosyl transferase
VEPTFVAPADLAVDSELEPLGSEISSSETSGARAATPHATAAAFLAGLATPTPAVDAQDSARPPIETPDDNVGGFDRLTTFQDNLAASQASPVLVEVETTPVVLKSAPAIVEPAPDLPHGTPIPAVDAQDSTRPPVETPNDNVGGFDRLTTFQDRPGATQASPVHVEVENTPVVLKSAPAFVERAPHASLATPTPAVDAQYSARPHVDTPDDNVGGFDRLNHRTTFLDNLAAPQVSAVLAKPDTTPVVLEPMPVVVEYAPVILETSTPRPDEGLQDRLLLRLLGARTLALQTISTRVRNWDLIATAVIVLVAAVLRFWHLGRPDTLVFDETYYVKDAYTLWRNGFESQWPDDPNPAFEAGNVSTYLNSAAFVVHPQVGKWLIALGMMAGGGPTHPFAWRLANAVFGVLAVWLVSRIARRLFASTEIGLIAGLLMAVDGGAIAHSRTALLDQFVMVFVLAAFGALLLDREQARRRLAARSALAYRQGGHGSGGLAQGGGWFPALAARAALLRGGPWLGFRWWRLLAGVLLGLAAGVKWSGIYFLAVFGLLTVLWDLMARRAVAREIYSGVASFQRGVGVMLPKSGPVVSTAGAPVVSTGSTNRGMVSVTDAARAERSLAYSTEGQEGIGSAATATGSTTGIGSTSAIGWGLLKDGLTAFLTMVPAAALTYLLTWFSWLRTPGAWGRHWASDNPTEGVQWLPPVLRSLWHYHTDMWSFHTTLSVEHAYASSPLTWLIQWRPTLFFWQGGEDAAAYAGCEGLTNCVMSVHSLGNPLLWWLAFAALLAVAFGVVRRDWRALAALSGVIAGWAPWLLHMDRTIFAFYSIVFTPWMIFTLCYVFMLLLEAGQHRQPSVGPGGYERYERYQRYGTNAGALWLAAPTASKVAIVAILALIVFVTILFYPIWTATPIEYDRWHRLMWLPSWI